MPPTPTWMLFPQTYSIGLQVLIDVFFISVKIFIGFYVSYFKVKLSIRSRSFSVSGPTVWNALPDYLRNPTLSIDVFKRYLKNVFIRSVLARRYSALETLCLCAI